MAVITTFDVQCDSCGESSAVASNVSVAHARRLARQHDEYRRVLASDGTYVDLCESCELSA